MKIETYTCEKCHYDVEVGVVYHVCVKPKPKKPFVLRRPKDSYPTAQHGTRACYQNGCRERPCVEANYAYQKVHRERRKAAGLPWRYDRYEDKKWKAS